MFAQPRSRPVSPAFLAILIALGILLLLTTLTFAKSASTIVVNPGQSIQAAINSANPGDTIVINAGTYTENLTLSKPVSLTGVNSATVIIRAAGVGSSVLYINNGTITNSVVISGMTLTGGYTYGYGGGIGIDSYAWPLIRSVIISGNQALFGRGGGLSASGPLDLIDVEFINNVARDGGGLVVYETSIFTNCLFFNNQALDSSSSSGGGAIFNDSGAVYGSGNAMTLINTNLISNTTAAGGGGIYSRGPVTIISGRVNFNRSLSSGHSGGGVAAPAITISGTRFLSNTSSLMGGAIAGGQISIINGQFEGNFASNDGGAIFAGSSLILTDTDVINSTGAGNGCGAYSGGTASVVGGQFANNRCITGSDFWAGLGGGLYSFDALTLSGTDFISNTGRKGGGAFARTSAIVSGSRFIRNHSARSATDESGGGMVVGGELALADTQFISNTAIHDGGGLYYYAGGNSRIVNTVFADNTTTSDGAALFFYSTGGHVDLIHTTIAANGLNPKQAIFVQNGLVGMTNTIIANHSIGIERWSGAIVYEDYNLFSGNTQNLSGTISSGIHHPVGGPGFVDPAHNDYHLGLGSAAIDTGIDVGVSTDLDGNPRPVRSSFDIGAYEFQYTGPIYKTYLPLVRK